MEHLERKETLLNVHIYFRIIIKSLGKRQNQTMCKESRSKTNNRNYLRGNCVNYSQLKCILLSFFLVLQTGRPQEGFCEDCDDVENDHGGRGVTLGNDPRRCKGDLLDREDQVKPKMVDSHFKVVQESHFCKLQSAPREKSKRKKLNGWKILKL